MSVLELARRLIDIESITGNEQQIGEFLFERLRALAEAHGGVVERMPVEANRFNVLARWGEPRVTLSTHMDTVPPFFNSREDADYLWGRGACDVKGIIAAMIFAAGALLAEARRDFAVLFVVGEERNSLGARTAAKQPCGSKYLINGEPTGNKLALGSKGALRYEIKTAGRMAHSAYPELGESAIEKLLDVLQDIRSVELPVDPLLGPSTLNIGLISGGRAPNVVADQAQAEIMIRLVDNGASTTRRIVEVVGDRAKADQIIMIPAVRLGTLDGFDTCVVAFTTDIPSFGGKWGEPFLIGPGSINYAHTSEERVPKKELLESVSIYRNLVEQLLAK